MCAAWVLPRIPVPHGAGEGGSGRGGSPAASHGAAGPGWRCGPPGPPGALGAALAPRGRRRRRRRGRRRERAEQPRQRPRQERVQPARTLGARGRRGRYGTRAPGGAVPGTALGAHRAAGLTQSRLHLARPPRLSPPLSEQFAPPSCSRGSISPSPPSFLLGSGWSTVTDIKHTATGDRISPLVFFPRQVQGAPHHSLSLAAQLPCFACSRRPRPSCQTLPSLLLQPLYCPYTSAHGSLREPSWDLRLDEGFQGAKSTDSSRLQKDLLCFLALRVCLTASPQQRALSLKVWWLGLKLSQSDETSRSYFERVQVVP